MIARIGIEPIRRYGGALLLRELLVIKSADRGPILPRLAAWRSGSEPFCGRNRHPLPSTDPEVLGHTDFAGSRPLRQPKVLRWRRLLRGMAGIIIIFRGDRPLLGWFMSDASPVVFVVDDDVSVRESLEPLIRDAGWHTETFGSAQEFLSRPRVLVPSCLVLDMAMPGLNGLELQKHVAADRSDMPIIFITGHGDVPTTVQAMKAGAVEFLTKPFSDDALLSAIRGAVQRSEAALRIRAEVEALQERHATLSRREREVMGLVVRGLLNKQVAFELGISEITVKAHRGQVMRKMQAKSFADLVNIAARLGGEHGSDG